MSKKPDWKLYPETAMMSYGYDPFLSEGAVICPEFHSTTYALKSAQEGEKNFKNPSAELNLVYSRVNHPGQEIFEKRLAYWEGAESCAAFSSGMAAISALCLKFLRPEDVLLYSEPIYGGTAGLFNYIMPEIMKIRTIGFSGQNFDSKLKQALVEHKKFPGLIFIETPANPTNALVDIEMCRKSADKLSPHIKIPIAVDNTFLGPIFQHPLKQGADISVYSATKYINGHSDVIAGACLGSYKYIGELKKLRMYLGSYLGPDSASRLLRSLQTLKLRMEKQSENALAIAKYLSRHPKIEKVYYLGLLKKGDADFGTYKKQCSGPGAVVSFDIRGDKRKAQKFLNSLMLPKLAVSLGSVESLVQHPYTMTHAGIPAKEKRVLGITPKMIRLAVGVENKNDLIKDLKQALETI